MTNDLISYQVYSNNSDFTMKHEHPMQLMCHSLDDQVRFNEMLKKGIISK